MFTVFGLKTFDRFYGVEKKNLQLLSVQFLIRNNTRKLQIPSLGKSEYTCSFVFAPIILFLELKRTKLIVVIEEGVLYFNQKILKMV